MKKLTILFLCLSFASWATTPFEMEEVDFRSLDAVEQMLTENPSLDYATLQKEHAEMLEGIELVPTASISEIQKDMPVVGAFWWGCCLGVVGLLVTYLITDNDKQQVKSALIGCIISTLLFGIGGVLDPFGWF